MSFVENLPTGVYEREQEEKGYYKVVLVGGRGAQSPELNEIQQIQNSQREKLVNTIASGTLISGGFRFQDDSSKVITLSESKINAQGYIFDLPETAVTPNMSGESTIGILLTKSYVTPEEDVELLNPVENSKNYNTKGALRLKFTCSWIPEPNTDNLNDNVYYYPIYSTDNGTVVFDATEDPNKEVYDKIARYDNDANGSYIISGMNMYYSEDIDNYHVCGISEGTAHVNGEEINFQYSKNVNIRKGLDTQSRTGEPIQFTSNGSYSIRHTPIAEISNVNGVKRETQRAVTHGSYSGVSDLIPNTPLVKIISISSDAAGNNKYVENTDYYQDGDYINWSPSGNEPSPGSTYFVTYQYRTTNVTYSINEDRKSITISGLDSGTVAYVDYTHYLKRIDSVILNKDGTVSIVEGTPSESNPFSQIISNGLVLSTVLIEYNKEPYFFNDYYRAVKMSDLALIKSEINKLRNNVAQLDLKTDISAKDPATTKEGMFVDPFYDDDQRDQGIEQNAEIVDQILYPEREWQIFDVHSGDDFILNRNSDVNLISQKYRTKSRKINEFNVLSESPLVYMSITPKVYRWTASTTQSITTRWGWYGGTYGTIISSTVNSSSFADTTTVYSVPRFTISITGSNFNANENVYIYIDNTFITSVVTNSSGAFSTSVLTPSNMKSGVKQVRAEGRTSGGIASTTLSTVPQIKTEYITQTMTYGTYYVTYSRDPIGQTFVNSEDCLASSVKLMFANKPASPVEVKLMETTAGYPDAGKVIGSKVLQPSQISTDSWVTFRFDSPVPMEANKYYAIAALSNEVDGSLYVAELGKRDDYNNIWMTKNVFDSGTLVQASQEYTWTAVQNEDLTFQIDRCNFQTGVLNKNLGAITVPANKPISQLALLADSKVYTNTSLQYTISLTGSSTNISASEYELIQLNESYSGNISITAKLSSTNSKLTPIINGDIQMIGASAVYPSTYVTRAFSSDGRYLKLYIDVLEYKTGQVTLQYQNSGGVWEEFDTDQIKFPNKNLGDGWVTKTYYKDLSESPEYLRVKITFNDMNPDNVSLPACKNLRVLTTNVEF